MRSFLGWATEHHEAGRVGSRHDNIGPSVAIQIGCCHAIDCSLAIAEAGREVSFAVAEKNTTRHFPMTAFGQHDVGMPSPLRSPTLALADVSETVSNGPISNELMHHALDDSWGD